MFSPFVQKVSSSAEYIECIHSVQKLLSVHLFKFIFFRHKFQLHSIFQAYVQHFCHGIIEIIIQNWSYLSSDFSSSFALDATVFTALLLLSNFAVSFSDCGVDTVVVVVVVDAVDV